MFVTKWMEEEEEGREKTAAKNIKKGLYFVQTEVTSISSCSVLSVMAEGRVGDEMTGCKEHKIIFINVVLYINVPPTNNL